MKFTKEQVVEKLNHVLTNGGKKPLRMSARTLESQVETLLAFVSDEEMELDAFVDKIKGGISDINSNIEHDNSDFIKKYKEEHPDPKPADPKPAEPDDPLSKLREELAELKRAQAVKEEQEAIATKRDQIKRYLSDNNVKNAKWIDSMLSVATIGKDDDVEEKGKTYLNLYNESLQGGAPVPPGAPSPSDPNPQNAFAELKELRKRRVENEKVNNS